MEDANQLITAISEHHVFLDTDHSCVLSEIKVARCTHRHRKTPQGFLAASLDPLSHQLSPKILFANSLKIISRKNLKQREVLGFKGLISLKKCQPANSANYSRLASQVS